MKKFFKYAAGFLVLAVITFAMGPRPDTNDEITFNPSVIGGSLDVYLAQSEAKVANLKPGAEKEIIWADPTAKTQTDVAIIYLHGFSATKHETRPLADKIADKLGANLYYARLKGHGRDGDAMAEARLVDWANDFAEAIAIGERLGKKIVILSTSTGSTLATWGLTKPELARNVVGVVMISPNFELQGIATWLANIPWAETILPAVAGNQRTWKPVNEEHEKWWTSSYPSKAIFPITAMLKILKSADKSQIKTPALFIYSPDDKVIVSAEIEKVVAEWGGPTEIMKVKETTDPYKHVIAGDILSPENTLPIIEKTMNWIKAL